MVICIDLLSKRELRFFITRGKNRKGIRNCKLTFCRHPTFSSSVFHLIAYRELDLKCRSGHLSAGPLLENHLRKEQRWQLHMGLSQRSFKNGRQKGDKSHEKNQPHTQILRTWGSIPRSISQRHHRSVLQRSTRNIWVGVNYKKTSYPVLSRDCAKP